MLLPVSSAAKYYREVTRTWPHILCVCVWGGAASPMMADVRYCYGAVRSYQNVAVVEKWQNMFQGYESRQEL